MQFMVIKGLVSQLILLLAPGASFLHELGLQCIKPARVCWLGIMEIQVLGDLEGIGKDGQLKFQTAR